MRLPHGKRAARGGFTLIELLVVIAIITILMGLLLAGVMALFSKGPETQDRSDISQMTAALQEFKAKYGFYPPSRLWLSNSLAVYQQGVANGDPLAINSLKVLGTMFPNMVWQGQVIDWTGNGNANSLPAQGVILEGDQCLVFFLGGIPGPGPSCTGFSTIKANPTIVGGERTRKLFEFQPGRLTNVFHSGSPFYSYLNPWTDHAKPYAYFSPERLGQNKYTSGLGTGLGIVPAYRNSDCRTIAVNPYISTTGATATFINPTGFQLISAGKDGVFGLSSTANSPVTVWTQNNTAGINQYGQDDIANFSQAILGAGQ